MERRNAMGFLGDMIKKGVGDGLSKGISQGLSNAFEKAVETAVKPAAENFANAAADNINEAAKTIEDGTATQKETKSSFEKAMENLEKAAANYNEAAEKYEKTAAADSVVKSEIPFTGTSAYFADLVSKNIGGVEIKEGVNLSEIATAPEKNIPIDVLISQGGAPKVAVLLVPKNSYKTMAVCNTMKACEEKGIKPLRFFREFANNADYVVGRIKAAL